PYAAHPHWLRRAEAIFKDARYLHLVRHPCGAVDSSVRRRFHRLFGRHWLAWDDNPWLYAEKFWAVSNRNILDFLREVDTERQRRLHFEALITDPPAALDPVCRFLGVSFDEAVLRPYEGDRMTHGSTRAAFTMGDPTFLN